MTHPKENHLLPPTMCLLQLQIDILSPLASAKGWSVATERMQKGKVARKQPGPLTLEVRPKMAAKMAEQAAPVACDIVSVR